MIDGKPLQGKRQVSVVVATGRKGDKGAPIEKDMFHLVEPNENKQKVKPYHTAFAAFNKAPKEKRRVLYGIITHITEHDALWYERAAQQLRVPFYQNLGWYKNAREKQQTVAHPNRLRACHGGGPDGKAIRWFGPGPNDFKVIDCPGDRCEFSIKMEGEKKAPCGLSMDFLFQLMWKDEFAGLPSVTARYPSHGMGTLRNFIGFFDEINTAIKALGIEKPVLYGFPFMMSLGEKTKPSEGWIWPTVTITPMMSPLDFFYAQTERRKQLKDMAAQIPAVINVTEEMEQRPTVYLMDEIGPLKIGQTTGDAIVTIEPEPIGEKTPTTPVDEGRQKTTSSSKRCSTSLESAALSETDGKNGHVLCFPTNWDTERKKKVARIGSAWEKVSEATLGNNIILDKDKDIALDELRFRIHAWLQIYADLGETDEWNSITIGGDIMAIPEAPMKGDDDKVCLASVAAKLLARWNELKKRKAA